MYRKVAMAALAAAVSSGLALTSVSDANAETKEGVKLGTLKCDVEGGWGIVFGSSKNLKCVYTPDGVKKSERYTGTIKKYGVDIGYTEAGVIIWTVIAPTKDVDKGALAGRYIGATAEASVALGVGANALVGGGNSIALQPLSISGQRGLNVAAGIGAVELKAAY